LIDGLTTRQRGSDGTDAAYGVLIEGGANATQIIHCSFSNIVDAICLKTDGTSATMPSTVRVVRNNFETVTHCITINGSSPATTVPNGLLILENSGESITDMLRFTGSHLTEPSDPPAFLDNTATITITNPNNQHIHDVYTVFGDLTATSFNTATGLSLSVRGSRSDLYGFVGSSLSCFQDTAVFRALVAENSNVAVGCGPASALKNFQVYQHTTGVGSVQTVGTTALLGTNTQFTNTFKIGDTITVNGETVRTISTITDNTHLTVSVAFSTSASGLSYTLTGGECFGVSGNKRVDIPFMQVGITTIANLPTGVAGMRAMVSNALTPEFGATVVAGGAVTVPVYFDTTWKVG
jgi:hypothetical protein